MKFIQIYEKHRISLVCEIFSKVSDFQVGITFFAIGSLLAVASGADSSFDLLNYHLMNGWRTLNLNTNDFLATSIWTFFPSLLDGIYYLLWKFTSPTFLNILIGGFQGLIGFFAYRLVRHLQTPEAKNSTKAFLIGLLTLSSPLTRSQFGSSMADLTLAVLEIFLFTEVVKVKLQSKIMPAAKFAVLLGVILALKPAHLSAVVAIGLLSIFKCNIHNKLKFTAIAVASFISMSLPWWLKAYVATGSPLFPYVTPSYKEILSAPAILHSYPDWEINSFSDLIKHLMYPGGGPAINSEIPFLDFAIPAGFIVLVLSILRKSLNSKIQLSTDSLYSAGQISLIIAIGSFALNQLVFTGARYSLVSYSLVWLGLGMMSLSSTLIISRITTLILILICCLNLLRPETTFYPFLNKSLTVTSVPDFGRTRGAYINNPARDFKPPYSFDSKDTVLFGQEQTSFVGPLWGINAHFIGLQAYILGRDSLTEINRRLEATKLRGADIYLVALSVNLTTERSQLSLVSNNFEIINCVEVPNPYDKNLTMCEVKFKPGIKMGEN